MFTGNATRETIPENRIMRGKVKTCVDNAQATKETKLEGTRTVPKIILKKVSKGSDNKISPRVAAKLI